MTQNAAVPAVLFDVDGTLVDSNYLHVLAWLRAFHSERIPVQAWKIHRSIGMDGATLIRSLAGDVDDGVAQRLQSLHSDFYRDTTAMLEPLPGARKLLQAVDELGLQVVLASSAPEDELSILRGVLDCDDIISAATSSRDVDTAKPDPDIVRIALNRAGVTAGQAVFIGDAVWDVEAAKRADVPCIGLRCGGTSQDELTDAGAVAVFDDPADLVDHLDTTPIAVLTSPR
jgi:HAD superfamily hydrolase (TIGR01509 family)